VVVNTQLVTVRQELDCAVVDDSPEMSCSTFSGKQLDDAVLHMRTFKLWLSTKKLPSRAMAANGSPIDAEQNTAEISYFASFLRNSATLWFNNLTIDVDPAHAANAIGNLTKLCTAFHLHFLFDAAQKWCHIAEFFKTKQSIGEKSEKYIRRVQEEGIKARANEEQILNTIMRGFLPFIQSSISNHDIEPKAVCIASVKKWSLVAKLFLPATQANIDTARLQKQIKELSAKLESTQMRVVNEPSTLKKAVQFEDSEGAQAMAASRTSSPEQNKGRAQGGSNRASSPAPADTRGVYRQRSRSGGSSVPKSGGRQSD